MGSWFATAIGLAVRVDGLSHDSYDDGHTRLLLKLTLWDEQGSTGWLPTVPGPSQFVPMLRRCVRLVAVGGQQASFEVAPVRPPDEAAHAPSPPRPCAPLPSGVAPLTDLASLRDGQRYGVVVDRQGHQGEWFPAQRPAMPHHYSYRFDWTNLVDHPELAAATSGRLRFTIRLLSHRVEPVTSQRRWRASYRAEVLEVCRL